MSVHRLAPEQNIKESNQADTESPGTVLALVEKSKSYVILVP